MNLKQAILALPKIDNRWTLTNGVMCFGTKITLYQKADDVMANAIEELHAAAKTLGYEIWWTPGPYSKGNTYFAEYRTPKLEHLILLTKGGAAVTSKSPHAAIRAAFIAAVEYKLKEAKN